MNYNDLTWAIFSALVWFAIESVLIFVCGAVPSLPDSRPWPGEGLPR